MSNAKTPEPEAPEAAVEVYTPTRIPKNGIVTAADLPGIADEFLKYVFPEESKQINADSKYGQDNKKTGKKEVSGYRSQYIINALNEVIGPGNWREYGTVETEKPAQAYVSIYSGVLEIGNWQTQEARHVEYKDDKIVSVREVKEPYFEVLARFEQTGGSRNMDKWESIKGAKTNFLKKVASYLSNGWKSYALIMDEDWNQAPPEPVEKPLPAPREKAPANAGQTPTQPGTATAKLISSVERDQIVNNFHRLGYTPEEVQERVKALELRLGKTFAEFTQGEARDTIKKMEAQIEKLAAQQPAETVQPEPTPEAVPETAELPEAAE